MLKWFDEESGQGMVEYVFILLLVVLVVIVALSGLGSRLPLKFEEVLLRFPE